MATYRSSTMGRRAGWILILMGLFELALAAGFWLFLGAVPPGDSGGMVITGLILGLVGLGMVVAGFMLLVGARGRDRISTTGLPGSGQILSVTQTGTFVNNNPQVTLELLVNVPGRAAYQARVKEIVPLIMLNRLQGTVPVRVDPEHPERVVIQWDAPAIAGGWTAAGIGGGFGPGGSGPGGPATGGPGGPATGAAGWPATAAEPAWSGPGSAKDETLGQVAAALGAVGGRDAAPIFGQAEQAHYSVEQIRAWLRANGLAAEATIEHLEDSGQTVGDERLFTMDATVRVPGHAPFRTGPSAAMVPLEKVGRIAVGVTLPARVAPDNPNMLMFEWDRI